MKVQDLRVGNLVIYNNKDFKVLEIYQWKIKAQSNKGIVEFNLSELQPIPLTEQRLIEFGFEKGEDILDYKNVYYFKNCWVSLDCYDNVGFDWIDETAVNCYETLYVHQLQNLYYSLTGNELK